MIAVGVDTHKHQHLAVALDGLGQVLAEITIADRPWPATASSSAGSAELGENVLVGIEGAGSYGAGPVRIPARRGDRGVRGRAARRRERRTGKSDRLDALLAAKKVLANDGLSTPRGSGKRLALQMLLVALPLRRQRALAPLQPAPSAPGQRTRRVCANGSARHATAPRSPSASPGCAPARPRACKRTPPCRCCATSPTAPEHSTQQAENYTRQIDRRSPAARAGALEEPGVGPICAGKLLAFNPARFKSEAAFARANGTAPQPASSGKTIRHRLSRGGDRQINAAIYTIALSRSVHHPPSRAYMQRRITEGKTKREAMRSLKRHLSRHLYNQLTKTPLTT